VFDYYAAAERVIFSVECDHHAGHHLCEEYGVTELLDEQDQPVADGIEGYMVGTTLHNLGMPLIRYRTTDRGARGGAVQLRPPAGVDGETSRPRRKTSCACATAG
jgi:phenylacetate-coenzyme A ligase PaaK-like adenylate-forming protein